MTILAHRGFGDTKLFAYLERLGFAYVIRFRGNIHVSVADWPNPRRRRMDRDGADERASCATPRSRRAGIGSQRSSVSKPRT